MDHADNSLDAKSNPHLQAVGEEVFRVSQQVMQVRRKTKVAQRSAAESFDKSADSHDRTAKSYEKLAELGDGTEYREHAARHREFAQGRLVCHAHQTTAHG
jgi:hypothetical protein